MQWLSLIGGWVAALTVTAVLAVVTFMSLALMGPLAPVVVGLVGSAAVNGLVSYLGLLLVTLLIALLLDNLPGLTTLVGFLLIGGIITSFGLGLAAWLLAALSALGLLLAYVMAFVVPTGIGYLVAGLGAGPTITSTPQELAGRYFLVGLNSGLNLAIALAVYPLTLAALGGGLGFAVGGPVGATVGTVVGAVLGAILGLALFVVNLLTLGPSDNDAFQGILGWVTPLMPLAWPVIALGGLLFLIDLVFHFFSIFGLTFLTIDEIDVNAETGTITRVGGLASNLNPTDGAYSLGTFIQIDTAVAPAAHSWVIDHETGHLFSLGAFGAVFHMVGWADQFWPFGGNPDYAERLAEGNMAPADRRFAPVAMW